MENIPGKSEVSPKVEINCWVTIQAIDGNISVTYKIVPDECAEPAAGRISALSPLGAALLGHIAGDSVEFEAHGAARAVRILKVIPTLPATR